MPRRPRSARRASRTSYIRVELVQHRRCRLALLARSTALEDRERVLHVLDPLLELVPSLHRGRHGDRAPSIGDHQRVLPEVRELLTNPLAQFGLGDDPGGHVRTGYCTEKRTSWPPVATSAQTPPTA